MFLGVFDDCRMELLSTGEVQSEDDQAFEVEADQDPSNWQTSVSTDVLALLSPHEIKRQEVINGDKSLFICFQTRSACGRLFYPSGSKFHMVTHVSVQSCSTQSALTCARWRCWIMCSTRRWPEKPFCRPWTSRTSSPTWRRSSSCTVRNERCT